MRLHFLVLVFLCFPGLLLGQVMKLTDPSEFSEDSLIFPTGREGADAREGLFSLGITLHGAPFSKPTVDVVITLPIAPPMIERVIRNEPLTGSSANRPLAIRFRFPVKRVGFELGNGSPETIATITAFTPYGELLGTVEQDQIDEVVGPFVGVETSNPAGIGSLVLDYGEDERAEQVSNFRVEYFSPPVYASYLSYLAIGDAADLTFQTQLVVSNFLFQQQHVHVAFFEGNGQPLEAEIDGVAASEVEFDLLRGATKNLLLTSTEGIKTGYARIESNFPLLVTGLLRTLGSGGSLISEAEIQTGNARQQFAMTVEVSRSENLDTAVAFVNVSEEENDVEARFWNPATGITITNPDRVTLAPGEQRAVFLEELFASAEEIVDFLEVNEAFTTMVTFRSRKPLAVTAIRTIRGVAQSSLSVGSREIGFVPTFPQGEP